MKTLKVSDRRENAFTLIELLIVIAIIAALAALVLSVMPAVSGKGAQKVANAELLQISTAIEAYKAKYGFYPPDNPRNVASNTLYYELVGTILTNTGSGPSFATLDGTHFITTNLATANLGVSGFANSATSRQGTDDKPAPTTFLKDLRPARIGSPTAVLLCSQEWSGPGNSTVNPWRYNSSHPTNNPGSYDLWVDLYINGKTQHISNWSKQ